jgi:hypothetical protein
MEKRHFFRARWSRNGHSKHFENRQPNDPADAAGSIQGYHRVVRYQPSLVANSPFDDIAYAFLGDVRNGQAPHTVVWDDACASSHRRQHGPTSCGRLVGPFAAGEPDTEPLIVRNSVYVPNR